jgi:hypothetical protein
MESLKIPLILRGEIIEDYEVEYPARHGELTLVVPDARKYVDRIVNSRPSSLLELHNLTNDECLDYIEELVEHLDFDTNEHIREAFRISCITSGQSDATLEFRYRHPAAIMGRELVKARTERAIGLDFLNGWVTTSNTNGQQIQVRAMGCRTLHIPAGNGVGPAFGTVANNIMTRSDAIIKVPSNDPWTAIAVARTMVEMAPDHPITKHLAVGYWKGGDTSIEDAIYLPRNIEKIVAWGGFASISHIAKYIQPGIDLVTLDPKLSASILGPEAFTDDDTMRDVAGRLAIDMFGSNQETCINSRVTHLVCGSDPDGVDKANRFGELLYQAMLDLPPVVSTGPKHFEPTLREEIEGLSLMGDEMYRVYGMDSLEELGAVIVSQESEPVDFAAELGCRVGNLVPIDDVNTAIKSITAYTQTIGVYPNTLKEQIRDECVLHGAQHIVSLGWALNQDLDVIHDGIEPYRRMVKWVIDTSNDKAATGESFTPGTKSAFAVATSASA